MRKPRGMAVIAALLVAMSVLVIVTTMLKTMGSELQATKLNGSQLQRHYVAKAALVDFVYSMKGNIDWLNHIDGDPIDLDSYTPQVNLSIRTDPYNASLIHLKAVCEGESVFQVVRDGAQGEGLLFSTKTAGPTPSFYSAARQQNGRRPEGGPEDGDEESPWRPISPPPSEVFNGAGHIVSFFGEPNQNYAADFRGKFYSVLSGPEGFSTYKYAGSAGWERLPARPAARFTASGVVPDSGSYTASDYDPVIFDATKDGRALWFVENVPPGPDWPHGASYLQTYDFSEETWSSRELPRNHTISPDGYYQVQSIALGDTGHAYLLTAPIASGQPPQILSLNNGSWEVVTPPPSEYFTPSGEHHQSSEPMVVQSITVDAANQLLVTAQTAFPDWYTASEYTDEGWDMALDLPELFNPLESRDFPASAEFQPISVDSVDYIVVGNSTSAGQGRDYFGFTEVYKLPGTSLSIESSRIGGGLRAIPSEGFRPTAEY